MLPRRLQGRAGRNFLLVTLGALTAFAPMATDLYLPAFPNIANSLGVDIPTVQVTLAASFAGLGAGQILYGPLSDRYGRRRPLIAGLVLFILASIGCAFSTTLPMLTSMRLLQALGGCAGLVIARAIVRDCYTGAAMARTMSLMTMVFALAPLIAPSVGAAIIGVAMWPWLFILLAAFGAVCLILVLFVPETHPAEMRTADGFIGSLKTYKLLMQNGKFLMPALISGFGSMTLFAYISSSPAVLMGSYGLSAQQFAFAFGGISVGIVLGSQINIFLLRRRSVNSLLRTFLGIQFTAALVLVALTLAGAPVIAVIICLSLIVACFSGGAANSITEALRPFPESAGSAAALIGVLQFGLGALIATVLGQLPGSPPLLMSIAIVIASAGGFAVSRNRRMANSDR